LDSPLLNDNDITGAQQVLLKSVTGDGEGEIRMSELGNIKNKIQEAAGRNVNIIEGIGIDPELGMAISVTVIATGFSEKRKPKGQITVGLDEGNYDNMEAKEKNIINNINKKEVKPLNDDVSPAQQALLLDEEIDFAIPTNDEPTLILDREEKVEEIIDPVVESHNTPEKVVFDLGTEYGGVSIEEEENAEEVISSILEEEVVVTQSIVLALDDEIDEKEGTLNTLEAAPVNTEVMKVEARERENRLRAISMQLRTPSGLTSLEDVPAYKRNNIELEDPAHSSESEVSTYTLTNGNNNTTELKQNNSFLHDNVD
jgi:cell division protein FtsZ